MNFTMRTHICTLPKAKFNPSLRLSQAALMVTLFVAPMVAHADGWGAISADDEYGERDPYFGIGGGASKNEAMKNSQKFCRDAGGKNCEVLVTYQECGAYAVSKKYSGTGVGSTKKIAERNALEQCSNKNCSVVVSDCNE
jgi:hypothetical protein